MGTGIRKRLLGLKKRLSSVHMYSIVISIIGVVAVLGISQYRMSVSYRQKLENTYNRAFYDVLGYVGSVKSYLIKSIMTTTPEKTSAMLQEAWRQASMAENSLSHLPVDQEALANTSRFLVQVADMASAYNTANMGGRRLAEEEYANIEQLYRMAVQLDENLGILHMEITEGRLKWGELTREGNREFAKEPDTEVGIPAMADVERVFKDYPRLIYDGPFSEHISEMEPRGLTGTDVSADTARETLYALFPREQVADIPLLQEDSSQGIAVYLFDVKLRDMEQGSTISAAVTRRGGRLLWLLYDKPETDVSLDSNQAIDQANAFMLSMGFTGMMDTYVYTEGNVAIVNYAYVQNGIIMYPDLIKVKVSMDDGQIIGFEAKGFYFAHMPRDLPAPRISLEEAAARVNPRMQVSTVGLAVIPTLYKTEVFCYEFKGKFMDNDFIVYINAETGAEQDILMILDTPGGVLTM